MTKDVRIHLWIVHDMKDVCGLSHNLDVMELGYEVFMDI
jgi:ABC-type branched-subunit amino acid transport system ATPase component